jgi:hypothetical protein
MIPFSAKPLRFGRPAAGDEDDGTGLPLPVRIRLNARRAAGIAEAKAILQHLPDEGESLHAVHTARMDLAGVIGAMLERLGRCDTMHLATLGFNARNLGTLLSWLDTGAVGTLRMVSSRFWRSHNGQLAENTIAEFRSRGHRFAVCDSHAKVVCMHFATGERWVIEGSANLCGSGSGREQIAVIRHADLCRFHAGWISDLLDRWEGADDGESG